MTTNFYTIDFRFSEFQILRTEAKENLLKDLRDKYNSTHSFFKHGEHIYISNKSGGDLSFDEITTISIENEKVTSSLIKHTFFKTFLENYPRYKLNGFYPFRLPAAKKENDLMRRFLPNGLKGKLVYSPQIESQVRRCYINGKIKYGFLVNIERRFKFNISLFQLASDGFNLLGKEVVHSVPIAGLKDIMLPDETFIGELKEIRGENAIVTTNEGDQEFELKSLFLRKTYTNIREYLTFALKDATKAESILNKLNLARAEVNKPEKKLEAISKAARLLFEFKGKAVSFENKDGFCFSVDLKQNYTYNTFELSEPTYVFDPSRTKTNRFNDIGLTQFGPYDKGQFHPKKPTIISICHKSNRGSMSTFMGALIDGMPQSKYFKKGLKSKYELHDINLEILEVDKFNIDEIKRVTRLFKSAPSLVILEIPASFKSEKDVRRSFYYQTKAHFLGLHIPIQVVLSENIINYNEFILNAISLQSYAKMGGVPWTIMTGASIDHEIIIGIGHSTFRSNAFKGNEQHRIVGISTFFSGDGQYMMSGDVKDVLYDEYFDELLISLRDSIRAIAKTYAWKQQSTVRLIFHIFKPLKNIEFEVVKELIKEFSQYNIKFAFVTITDRHPFLMFDKKQRGVQVYRNKVKGKYIPLRAKNIVLNETSCLIQMLGAKEIKFDKHGVSAPLLIRILEPTSEKIDEDLKQYLFHDLNYICQQVLRFSCLSWRGFLPNQKPATMLYSTLISKILGNLRKMPGWNSEVINLHLKRKKWFL